ncbi:hypothetical protein HDU99_007806, partial [Rhizoclosmatium hyalinum]
TNTLFSGGKSAGSIEVFCKPKEKVQLDWYSCLCDSATRIKACFESSGCVADPGYGTMTTTQGQYCLAAQNLLPSTTTTAKALVASGGNGAAVPTTSVWVRNDGSGSGPVLTIPGSAGQAGAASNTSKSGSSALRVSIIFSAFIASFLV